MRRIAVAGFQHETNTFAPAKASFEDFEMADGWPPLCVGAEMLREVEGMNLPVAGFVAAAQEAGDQVVPILWCSASPSAHVTQDAYERIVGLLLAGLGTAAPFDAIYLDIHGAMVTEQLEDGEGELLRRLRAAYPHIPIVGTLDLHANVTEAMIAHATLLEGYRTYPHVDMAETGRRIHGQLGRILDRGDAPAKAWRQIPFLIPLPWQCTLAAPADGIYARMAEAVGGDVLGLSFACGFPPADIRDCGPAVYGYGWDHAAVEAAVTRLHDDVMAHEGEFGGRLWTPDEAVAHALDRSRAASRPVILADTQDNPGGGAPSDTVGVLEALLRHDAAGAVLGVLCDAEVAALAHRAGVGATLHVGLGAKSGMQGHAPLVADWTVRALGGGEFLATGPFYAGSHMRLGPMALLETQGVRVVVSSRKQQAADKEMFRHLGVEPAEAPILVLKSSVHFRADFQPIAEEILVVEAPGPNVADPAKLPYRRLREGIRLSPKGPVHVAALA